MKRLTIIFILLHTLTSAQVTIKEIKCQPRLNLFNTTDSTITYPVVSTGKETVDEKINSQIRSELLNSDSEIADKPVTVLLDTAISRGLVFMSYEITFNKDNVLSFTVTAESCAAYCSHWKSNFNFNTATGNAITIDDIIKSDSKKGFTNYFMAMKTAVLMQYKEELKEKLGKGVDKETYDAAIEIVDTYCINSISLKKFSLSNSGIKIFDECVFPHVISDMQPVLNLNYTYKVIYEFLQPQWKEILMK